MLGMAQALRAANSEPPRAHTSEVDSPEPAMEAGPLPQAEKPPAPRPRPIDRASLYGSVDEPRWRGLSTRISRRDAVNRYDTVADLDAVLRDFSEVLDHSPRFEWTDERHPDVLPPRSLSCRALRFVESPALAERIRAAVARDPRPRDDAESERRRYERKFARLAVEFRVRLLPEDRGRLGRLPSGRCD
jgi:hypothetical protein